LTFCFISPPHRGCSGPAGPTYHILLSLSSSSTCPSVWAETVLTPGSIPFGGLASVHSRGTRLYSPFLHLIGGVKSSSFVYPRSSLIIEPFLLGTSPPFFKCRSLFDVLSKGPFPFFLRVSKEEAVVLSSRPVFASSHHYERGPFPFFPV